MNAPTQDAPFGEFVGDVIWPSIKRRDNAPVHDWCDPRVIKNLIVGREHEGCEIYAVESRLVDTVNQSQPLARASGTSGPQTDAAHWVRDGPGRVACCPLP